MGEWLSLSLYIYILHVARSILNEGVAIYIYITCS